MPLYYHARPAIFEYAIILRKHPFPTFGIHPVKVPDPDGVVYFKILLHLPSF
jgi:hypothetical protein